MDGLDLRIRQGWAAADRDHFEPIAARVTDLLAGHPTDVRIPFHGAGALDSAGQAEAAACLHERALAGGLAGDDLRRGLVPYGSTLGRIEAAVACRERADREVPGGASVALVPGLALLRAGRADEAVARLIVLALDGIDSEERERDPASLRGNAAALTPSQPSA